MASEKRYPLSELKRERLRKLGIVPVSIEVTNAAVLLGAFLLVVTLYRTNIDAISAWYTSFKNTSAGSTAYDQLVMTLKSVFFLAGSGIFTIVVFVVAVGLFQTRFLFRLGLNGIDFSRLFQLRQRLGHGFIAGFFSLSKVVAWGAVSVLIIVNLLTRAPSTWENTALGQESIFAVVRSQLFNVVGIGCICCFFIAVLSRFVVVLAYTKAQMMTREEVEAELRETEMAPEFRIARDVHVEKETKQDE